MEIEKSLHNLVSDPKYREMQSNLKVLETSMIGSRHVRIGVPENLDKMVELRRNSKEMDDLIQRYKNNLEKYKTRIDNLNKEKSQLQRELFPT
jgi:hypothetical protein